MKNNLVKATLALALSIGIAASSVAPSFASEPATTRKVVQVVKKPVVSTGSPIYKELKNGLFDYEYYKANNPDVVAVFGDSKEALLRHFINYGMYEGRQPNVDFNINAYASAYDDLKAAFDGKGSDYQVIYNYYNHYAKYGKNEEREITSIEKATEAGITVTKVGTDEVINDTVKNEAPISWGQYNSLETRVVEVQAPTPGSTRVYQSVYDSSMASTVANAMGFVATELKALVDNYPELKNNSRINNTYTNYLSVENPHACDFSIEVFRPEGIRSYFTNENIDLLISDASRAAQAKADLAYTFKVYDELSSIELEDFTEVRDYEHYVFGHTPYLRYYTYVGYEATYMDEGKCKYYATEDDATAAFNADVITDPQVQRGCYKVAAYPDFASARAAFLNDIPEEITSFSRYLNQVGVTPLVCYLDFIGFNGVSFAAYFDVNMLQTNLE